MWSNINQPLIINYTVCLFPKSYFVSNLLKEFLSTVLITELKESYWGKLIIQIYKKNRNYKNNVCHIIPRTRQDHAPSLSKATLPPLGVHSLRSQYKLCDTNSERLITGGMCRPNPCAVFPPYGEPTRPRPATVLYPRWRSGH